MYQTERKQKIFRISLTTCVSSVVHANKFYTFCHDDEWKGLSITPVSTLQLVIILQTTTTITAMVQNMLHPSTHNLYLRAAPLHMLQGPKHLLSPPLPVAFLLFLHQYCGIVWYETTATCATVRMSVSNKCKDFYSQWKTMLRHYLSCWCVHSDIVYCQCVNLWQQRNTDCGQITSCCREDEWASLNIWLECTWQFESFILP